MEPKLLELNMSNTLTGRGITDISTPIDESPFAKFTGKGTDSYSDALITATANALGEKSPYRWAVNPMGSANLQTIAGYKRDGNWGSLIKFLTFQLQETIEQVVAFNERDQEGFRDATADVRVLLDAQQSVIPWSLESDYNEVVGKLYTRFDPTQELAEQTQAKYKALGVTTYIVHDHTTGMYVNRVSETVDGTDGEHYPKDKWLKSVNVQFPNFDLMEMSDTQPDSKILAVKNRDTFAVIGTKEEIRAWLAAQDAAE